MIDKKQIHKIEDGQRGSEVAENMKSNFDMLADAINTNEVSISDIRKSSFKKAIVIKVDEQSIVEMDYGDVYELSHTQEELNEYITQILENPHGTDVFVIIAEKYIKMNIISIENDDRSKACIFNTFLGDGTSVTLQLSYDYKNSCLLSCEYAFGRTAELSLSILDYIKSEFGFRSIRKKQFGTVCSYSFEYVSHIAGETIFLVIEPPEFNDLFKMLMAYAKHNQSETNLTNSYYGKKLSFIICDIGDNIGDIILKQAFAESSARFIRLSKDIVFINDMCHAFANCKNLEAIEGEMYLRDNCDIKTAFDGCRNLEYFCISNLNTDLDISGSPMVKPCCILHLIRNADKKKTIKIKVHKSIYDAINGASEEWQSVRDALSGGGNLTISTT